MKHAYLDKAHHIVVLERLMESKKFEFSKILKKFKFCKPQIFK
mgnify:CR=1 FL=1